MRRSCLFLFCVFIAYPAAIKAQRVYYLPCLVDVQVNKQTVPRWVMNSATNKWEIEGASQPIWESPKTQPFVYNINGGNSWSIPIVMPVPGNCKGGFDAKDNRDDLAVVVQDNLGRYIRKQPPGDIEILVMDEMNFAAFSRGKSFASFYSSGRQFSGDFNVPLPAGCFRLVISNRHSYLAGKQVTFTLGEGVPKN